MAADTGKDLLLLDVTPMSLSIETVGGVATRLVERNSTLPTRYSKIFSTAAPYQRTVEIHVLQGERPMARDNKTIGKFKLKGIKPAPAGVPQIEVTFDIDANGILKVSARDMDTGKEQSITITANDRMSEEEIRQAMADAQNYAGQDQIRREAMEVLNDSQSLLARTEQSVKNAGKQLDKSVKKQVKADITRLRKLVVKCRLDRVTETEIEEMRSARAQLEQSAAQIGLKKVFSVQDLLKYGILSRETKKYQREGNKKCQKYRITRDVRKNPAPDVHMQIPAAARRWISGSRQISIRR